MRERFFRDKGIVIISPESWSHLFISKHHYAIELSKHNKVFFVNPPSKSFSIEKSQYENLWIVNYTPLMRGLRFFPAFVVRRVSSWKWARIERLMQTQIDCVWSFDNSVFFDFGIFQGRVLKISHLVDFSQNFQLNRAASTADLCFGVSQNIVDRLTPFNRNSFLINHGISLGTPGPFEVQLPGKNLIKAVYAGNLDSRYIDRPLLFSIIERHPEVDFIFLGSGGADWPTQRNTFFLGKIEHHQLMTYLKKADVLLLVYDVDKYPDQLTNAHKILEYLASGKVTVSTLIRDYEEKSYLLEMARDKGDFPTLFGKIISNLALYNSNENALRRMEFASRSSYAVRLQEIEEIIRRFYDGNGRKHESFFFF